MMMMMMMVVVVGIIMHGCRTVLDVGRVSTAVFVRVLRETLLYVVLELVAVVAVLVLGRCMLRELAHPNRT
uniref:Putative secreted peptide n=1 Tax=Anopheles braziliensis TaxID=58242 RepID=A0A2M3ZNJ1_9DIPT